MNVLQKLTLRHLRQNRKRTVITLIAIALSVGMVTAVSGLVVSFQDMMYRNAVKHDGDWHVMYMGVDPALAEQIAADPVFTDRWETRTDEEWEGVSVLLRFQKLDRHLFTRSEDVCYRYNIAEKQVRYHNDLLIAKGLMPGGYFDAIYGFASILFVLIAAGSVMVICNAFTISADSRGVQFGLLKSTGATNRQVRGMVFFEGAVLLVVAVPVGILLGLLAELIALSIANYVFHLNPYIAFTQLFRVVVSPLALVVSVAAALVTVFFAALLPAVRAGRLSPVEAIRQTRSVRIRPREVRVRNPLVRLFGFEGLLAAKTMKRNRGRYRITVLSLVVSIVLYIGVAGFGQMLLQATTMVYGDRGSNVTLNLYGDDAAWQDRIADDLRELSGEELHAVRRTPAYTYLTREAFTASGSEYLAGHQEDLERYVNLFSIGQAEFEALCRALRLDPNAMANPGEPQAILLNTTGTFSDNGRYTNITPYALRSGDRIHLEHEDVDVTLAAVTGEIPPAVSMMFGSHDLNLILAEPTRSALSDADYSVWTNITVLARDADRFEALALDYLGDKIPEDGAYYLTNYEAMARSNRSFGYLVMTFVYGFIAMLSLIAVTSVITTISTGVALRGRELAMLRSVGMTGRSIDRMLNYESLLYALKALVIGIPLGLAACLLMFRALNGALEFEFRWPVGSVLVSVAAVLLLSFATTALSRRKQRHAGIVDALRNDMI